MEKRKKRFGDRYDGYRIRSLSPMDYVAPFIMKNRNDSCNLFAGSVELGRIENYIKRKRRDDGLVGFGFLHVVVAAYIRTVSQKPAINRFIAGQRIYQHGENITVSMNVKKNMELNAQETVIKVDFTPADTVYDVYHKMNKAIEEAKKEGDSISVDKAANIINHMPALVMRAFFGFVNFLDYFGIMPKFLYKVSPSHTSAYITNLGSLGIQPVYHHLYNFGTCPLFIAFGAKRTKLEVQKDGSIEKHKYIDYHITTDDRITDGYYYASAFKQLDWLLRHPDVLDTPPEQIIHDID